MSITITFKDTKNLSLSDLVSEFPNSKAMKQYRYLLKCNEKLSQENLDLIFDENSK